MSDNLQNLARQLSSSYRVIVPDLINHGSSPHRQQMDYPLMAEDVHLLLQSLDISQYKIMGHSMGGKVAMQMAHDYPESVSCVVIADIAPVTYHSRHDEIISAMFEVADSSITQRKQADAILAGKIPEAALRQFFMKNMHKDAQGLWQWRFGLANIASAYNHLAAAPCLTHLIHQPVLFIKGGESDYITEQSAAVIKQNFDSVSFKIISGAGHWLHAEKPLIFNRLVADFFSSNE